MLQGFYSATVTAEMDCIFCVVDDIADLIRSNPEIGMDFYRVLAHRVVNMNVLFLEIKKEIEESKIDDQTKKESSKLYKLISDGVEGCLDMVRKDIGC